MADRIPFPLDSASRGRVTATAAEGVSAFATVAAPPSSASGSVEAQLPLAQKYSDGRPRLSGAWTWHSGPWVQAIYVFVDVLCVCLIGVAIFSLRFLPGAPWGWIPAGTESHWQVLADEYLGFLLLYAALVVLCCQSQNLYQTVRTRTPLDEGLAVFKAVALATLFLTAFIYLSGVKSVSRLVVALTGLLTLAALVAWRLWRKQVIQRRAERGIGLRNALIVGAGNIGRALARYLEQNRHLGFAVAGFLDHSPSDDPRLVGTIEDLPRIARAHFVDEIFITIPSQRELVKEVALEARRNRLNVRVVPELYDGLAWHAPFEYVGEFPVRVLHCEPIPVLGLLVKRAMDVAFSAAALVVTAPLLAVLAAAVKFDSPGPVFYRAPRVGWKGRTFTCYKFRTMVANADAIKSELRHRNERNGPFFKLWDDPRVTRLGRWLRKYSLDELPQFWNVLRGEMSLVGPRPHPVDDFQEYRLEHLRRLDVKPGLTGLWQVTARQDPSFERNLELDLEYIETWSLWLDVKILLRTLPAALRGTGA